MNTGKAPQLLANTTGTGAQTAVVLPVGFDVAGSAQVEVTATGTVEIQGRLGPDAPWVVFNTISASGITNMARVWPEMRANITANTGTIRVWVMN